MATLVAEAERADVGMDPPVKSGLTRRLHRSRKIGGTVMRSVGVRHEVV